MLAAVVGLAGGIIRDLLIGVPPATFRDWRYLAAAGAAGLVCFFAWPVLERIWRSVLVFDAVGLGLFCVTGATKALDFGVGPVPGDPARGDHRHRRRHASRRAAPRRPDCPSP